MEKGMAENHFWKSIHVQEKLTGYGVRRVCCWCLLSLVHPVLMVVVVDNYIVDDE
eukprot:m.54137 g.54137  ORF g.54137 m.54137 type:complete len:55 (-) comp7704_c0_seq1:517-681(-)